MTVEVNTISKSVSTDAKGTASLKAELVSSKETIWLTLYNFGGQQVGNPISYEVEKGKVKIAYTLGNLPTGNYILKVDGTGWSDSKQIIIE
ncbi:hypothetical protein [Maribacter halichondriae]|uniref:hypothetical protein n=1 Tax=Maribacter halichondriae TaxID=2980554 RepID=UPI002358C85C|nr:hypothetical protein [Maribacter sp. Hal144]